MSQSVRSVDFVNKRQFEKKLAKDANPQKRNKRPDTPIPDQAIEEYQADVKKRKIQKRNKRPDTPIPDQAIEEYQADVKKRKIQKRNKRPDTPIPDQAIEEYQADVKKRKLSQNQSMDGIAEKVQGAVAKQIESRQQCSDLMLNSLSEILTQLDSEDSAMTEYQDKLEQHIGKLLKCIQQSNAAKKQKHKSLWEIHAAFRKRCEDMIKLHKEQNEKLIEDVEEDLKIFEQEIIRRTKKNIWDNMHKALFHAMQNDF